MGLFITKIPDLNPVRNPIRVKMATDGPITTAGAGADILIDVDAGISLANVGQVLTLTFGDETVVEFTQAATPDPLLGQYDGATDVDVADALQAALEANYYIATHFYITRVNATQIRLLSIETGTGHGPTDIDITFNSPAVLGFSPGGGPGGLTGIDEVTEPNYGALMQVWVQDSYPSGEYALRLEEVYPVNSEFVAEADISRALRAYLYPPYVPSSNLAEGERMLGNFKRFLVRAGERSGNPPVIQGLSEDSNLQCHLAGRSEVARAGGGWEAQMTGAGDYWRFMTNWPNTSAATPKRVRPVQREFLAVVVQDGDIDELRLKVDLYYTDYTVAMDVLLTTYTAEGDILRGEQVIFPVGVEQMGLEDFVSAKTLSHYTIYLDNEDGDRVSEQRFYVVDREHHEYLRQFHYLSTAGGMDTVALVGPRSELAEAIMQRGNRNVPIVPDDIMDVRDNADMLEAMNVVHELGTEHLYQDELEALRELISSELVIERVAGRHWPVRILTTKLELGDEAAMRRPVALKYRYAVRNNANTLRG